MEAYVILVLFKCLKKSRRQTDEMRSSLCFTFWGCSCNCNCVLRSYKRLRVLDVTSHYPATAVEVWSCSWGIPSQKSPTGVEFRLSALRMHAARLHDTCNSQLIHARGATIFSESECFHFSCQGWSTHVNTFSQCSNKSALNAAPSAQYLRKNIQMRPVGL